jgi:hypothetical protein
MIARNTNIWMLPGFSTRDLVAVQIKYLEGKTEKSSIACSAYLPYDSEEPPPTRELEEKKRTFNSLWGATPIAIIPYGVAPTAMIEDWRDQRGTTDTYTVMFLCDIFNQEESSHTGWTSSHSKQDAKS